MREHYDQQGLEHPADFYPPDILPQAVPFLNALNRLAADRPRLSLGMSGIVVYGRIPFLSVDRYAARHGIDGVSEFARFDRIIGAVDSFDVEYLNEQAAKKTK
jgi:hypothetical protein